MSIKKTLLGLLFGMLFLTVNGQDVHYSMFQMAPLSLNPSLAGSFYGTSRIGGIFRTQDIVLNSDEGGVSRTYDTYSAYLDAPIVRGFRKQDWIGLGLGIQRDVAGVGDLAKLTTVQAISYHMPVSKDGRNVFSIGINSGSISLNGMDQFTFESNILGMATADDTFLQNMGASNPGGGTQQGRSSADWAAGISFKGYLDDISSVRLGLSGNHLFNPFGRRGGGGIPGFGRIPITMMAFGEYDRLLNPRTRLIPAVLFQNSGQFNTVAIQTLVAYYFDPQKDITIYGGVGARTNFFNPLDAIPIYMGFDVGDIQARFAYDVTVSGKNFTNGALGAFEVSLSYIIKVYKRPKVDPAIFCPRF